MPLQILITNNRLAKRTGTELYAVELAEELLRRGVQPAIYSPHLGRLAEAARAAAIPVAARLDQIGFSPDVIHGHHAGPVAAAGRRFPGVPVVFVSHSWRSAEDEPPAAADIRRYVAVDAPCRDRLVGGCGVPAALVELHPNFVNLARFRLRPPLPDRPRRAALFTNRGRFAPYVATLRRACRSRGIAFDLLGGVSGRTCDRPEDVLGQYDVVFCRAKAALEAMAVGAAVILCDRGGLGTLVTAADVDRLRPLNFGRRALSQPLTVATVGAELDRYDPRDAMAVSERIRQVASLTHAADRLLDLYRAVIAEHAALPPDQRAAPAAVLHAGESDALWPSRVAAWLTRPFRRAA